jgi:hypothetical protein
MTGDCVMLVADNDIRAAVEGLLTRPHAVPMRPIRHASVTHPQRDPGVRLRSRELLAAFRKTHTYALAILDHEGCGGGSASAAEVEAQIEQSCAVHWADRIRAIAIDPEIESWVWSDSPRVDAALGWSGRSPDLRDWLTSTGYVTARHDKPHQPKEAFDAALRLARSNQDPQPFLDRSERPSVSHGAVIEHSTGSVRRFNRGSR